VTQLVLAAIPEAPYEGAFSTLGLAWRAGHEPGLKEGRVTVTCGSGHLNVFTVTYRVEDRAASVIAATDKVTGIAPSQVDQLLQGVVKSLAPDQSYARIQDYAKTLLNTAGLVGSILTGFSLLNRQALAANKIGLLLLVLAILLTVFSVGFSLLAIAIDSKNVFVGDMKAVFAWYGQETKWRQRWARWSGYCLFLALFAASLAVIAALVG
jgi:hypothetical protein